MIITAELVERCAKAAYGAAVESTGPHRERWEGLQLHWQRIYRQQARAVLEEALRPEPQVPMEGQLPLLEVA